MENQNTTQKKTSLTKSQLFLLIAFLLGIFIGGMDAGIVSPARTVIEDNLNITPDKSVWIISLYTLFYAISMPILGKLSDIYGKKRIFILIISIFMIGSFISGISDYFHNFSLLLIARAFQGLGGGGILPIASSYVGKNFPIEKKGTALGIISAIYGIATLLGPTIGSFILQVAGDKNWGYLFFVNVPICIIALIIAIFTKIPESQRKKAKLDYIGCILLSLTIISLMYAATNINFEFFLTSFSNFKVWFFLLLFGIFLPFLIIHERRIKDPVLQIKYFTQKETCLALIMSFFVGCRMMGTVFIPQFSENMLRLRPGTGGYVVTIVALFAAISGPTGGKLIDKTSSKFVLIIGFLTTLITFVLFSSVVIPRMNIPLLFICCMTMGIGKGFTIGTPLNYLIQLFAPKGESSSAQATLSLMKSIGIALSPNILVGFISKASSKIGPAIVKIIPSIKETAIESHFLEEAQNSIASQATSIFEHSSITNIVPLVKDYSQILIKQATQLAKQQSTTAQLQSSTMLDLNVIQQEYLTAISNSSSLIEETYQKTINYGFANMFIMLGIFSAICLILTLFLNSKEIKKRKEEILT